MTEARLKQIEREFENAKNPLKMALWARERVPELIAEVRRLQQRERGDPGLQSGARGRGAK